MKRFCDLPGRRPSERRRPGSPDVFAGRRVLALIPARGGSKGLPGKNVAPLDGRPLIAWTIAAARDSAFVDEIVVTTDDDEIAEAAAAAGARVPFRRPAALAADEARMGDVIAHALETLATTDDTLRLAAAAATDLAAAHRGSYRRGVRPPDREQAARGRVGLRGRAQPRVDGELPPDGNMAAFGEAAATRANRQELGRFYRLNGAVYLADVDYWRAQAGFLGPATYA